MDDFEWNVENEAQLLEAIVDHKPVGINKHFQMVFIWEKLTEISNKEIRTGIIWDHLKTMYNLESLDESESFPFPNNEAEFYLPESEFGSLKLNKRDERQDEKKYTPIKGKELPKLVAKEIVKKEEKIFIKKEVQRRDSKDGKDMKIAPIPIKKDIKKEPEKKPQMKGRTSISTPKEETKMKKVEESPRPPKRPTRGSMKPDDAASTGKASPVTVSTNSAKRRRI